MLEYIRIGQIVNLHGLKGDVKIYSLTDNLNRFKKLEAVLLEKKDGYEKLKITSVKFLAEMVILHFEGIDTPEMAQKIRNQYICVDRENTVKLPKDTFLICDLIGLTVKTMDGETLGILTEVLQPGSNDVYIVKPLEGEDILVPALKSVVKKIDFETREAFVELPEGLLD